MGLSFVEAIRRSLPHFLLACSLFPLPSSLLYAGTVWDAVEAGHITWSNAETNWLSNGDFVLTYKTGEGSLTLPGFARGRALAVGGGGAGSDCNDLATTGGGGGGGAGGFVETNSLLLAGGTYAITVGAGGAKHAAPAAQGTGNPGSPSSVSGSSGDIMVAAGGGGGGFKVVGAAGGSGGGAGAASANATSGPRRGGYGTAGQGNDGGRGSIVKYGGGGGGAGGPGKESVATGTPGGLAKPSLITGTEVWYAGGGGGGSKDETSVGLGGGTEVDAQKGGGGNGANLVNTTPDDGVDGFGGGGGGAASAAPGGAGGDGVVIIRISLVVDGPIPKPTDEKRPYTGEEIVVNESIPGVYEIEGANKATNVNETAYAYTATLAEGLTWSDGDPNPVHVNWWIVPGTNSIPVPLFTSVPYDGIVHTAVFPAANVEFEGVTESSEAGTHTYTAKLIDKANWRWADGSVTNQTFSWTIEPKSIDLPVLPEGAVYGGTNVVATTNNPNYAFADGSVTSATNAGVYKIILELNDPANTCWPDGSVTNQTLQWSIARLPVDYPPVRGTVADWTFVYNGSDQVAATNTVYYEFSGTTHHVNKGEYQCVATLNGNWCWKDSLVPTSPYPIPWSILQATNEITSLQCADWKLGETPSTPSCTVRYGDARNVRYTYGKTKDGPWSDAKPETNGVFYVRAFMPADDDFGNWSSAERTKRFLVYKSFDELFTDYVDLDFSDYEGDPLDDCRIRVKISEELFRGFSYARCGGPDNLAFMDMTYGEDGSPLSYAVEVWNENGESYVWVRLPRLDVRPGYANTKVRMYWRLRDGMEAPGPSPEDVEQAENSLDTTPFLKHGFIWQDGVQQNYWITEPGLTKSSWDVTEPPGEVIPGEPAVGEVVYVCVQSFTGGSPITNALPTAAGRYSLTFTCAIEGFNTLEKKREFSILGHSEDPRAGPTEEGRILLANDDSQGDWGETSVTNQSPWQVQYIDHQCSSYTVTTNRNPITGKITTIITNWVYWTETTTNATYWVHSGESTHSATYRPYLLTNSMHTLVTTNVLAALCGSSRIWDLRQIRLGNLYDSTLEDYDGFNYLSWSTTSCAISSNGVAFSQREVGNMMMRNTTDAAIYSPCYTNGIGTIYFDAVNFQADGKPANYRLVVEIATAVKDAPGLLPTDENVKEGDDPYALADWKPVKATMVKIVGDTVTVGMPNETIELDMQQGGTHANFYRIFVPLSLYKPVRFRIRRVSVDPDHDVEGDRDAYGQILLDNLIVSKPTLRADMETYGKFDPAKKGPSVLGMECATTVPYPANTDDDIHGRARAVYTTAGETDVDTNAFVTAVKFHYRWRYLQQNPNGATDWQEPLDMRRDANGFIETIEPLKHPGAEGDVEYWFETFLQSPFYSYVDYSGTDHKLNGSDGKPYYSEEIPVVTNSLMTSGDVALLEDVRKTSLGDEWFVRLRNGHDLYGGATLVVNEGAMAGEYPMHLAEDSTWRCLLQVPRDAKGVAKFYFRLNDRVEPGATEITPNERYMSPTNAVAEFPMKGRLVEGIVPCAFTVDHAANYLEFRFNDEFSTFAVTRAEYQTFNEWNDAHTVEAGGKAVFFANFNETNGVNTAAMTTNAAPIAGWPLYVGTNVNWNETFYLADYNDPGYPKETIFPSHATPASWGGDYIAFVPEQLGGVLEQVSGQHSEYLPYPKASGMAGKLIGQGKGKLSFMLDDRPDGVERVTYRARIGQSLEFENLNYSWPAGRKRNYMFTTLASMSHLIGNENQEGDMAAGAALSLVAYHRERIGCYEFRIERIEQGGRLMMSIWKWHSVNGELAPTCLVKRRMDDNDGSRLWTDNSKWKDGKTDSSATIDNPGPLNPEYRLMFISVETKTDGVEIYGGISYDAQLPCKSSGATSFNRMENGYCGLYYKDTTADRHTFGAYGLGAKDCPAEFLMPAHRNQPIETDSITLVNKDRNDYRFLVGRDDGDARYFRRNDNKGKDIGADGLESDVDDIRGDDWGSQWVLTPNRIEFFTNTWLVTSSTFRETHQGLRMPGNLKQSVIVQMASVSRPNNWEAIGTNTVSGYGFTDYELPLYRKGQYNLRFTTGEMAVDVVVDNVKQTKWMGTDTASIDYLSDRFVYTQCHIVTNTALKQQVVELVPSRAHTERSLSIRSPILDGLGKITFNYADVDSHAEIWVQMATNNVTTETLPGANGYNNSVASVENGEQQEPGEWITLAKYKYADLNVTSKKKTVYVGLHNNEKRPIHGVFRLFVPTNVVAATDRMTSRELDNNGKNYGRITITSVTVWDEPGLDERSWRGWNLRTVGSEDDKEKRMYLADMAIEGGGYGLVCALNNSVNDITTDDAEKVVTAYPTIWSPTLGTYDLADGSKAQATVGEVTFKARLYDDRQKIAPCKVTLYGSTDSLAGEWRQLGEPITVDKPYFQNYSWKAGSESFAAIRFEITDPSAKTTHPKADRVILDEITICERVQPTLSFVYAWPFRDGLNGDQPVANVGDPSQQPLAGENWGVQAKLALQQLGDEVDLDRGIEVRLVCFAGGVGKDGKIVRSDWGYENWKGRATNEVRLEPVGDPEDLVFRSVAAVPASVMPPSPDAGTVVQFMLRVKYYDRGGYPYEDTMRTWTRPYWYHPVDYNAQYGSGFYAAYTILDRISPGRAWINELNWNNGSKSVTHTSTKVVNNQFIEICVPSGVDLEGWKVRVTNLSETQLTLATLGRNGVASVKSSGAVNGYSFLLLESPETNLAGGIKWPDGTPAESDGTWNADTMSTVSGGTLSYANPFQFELVRPSGVVEHAFTIDGTNEWGTARYEATNLLERLNVDGSKIRFYAGRELEKNENGSNPATKGTTFGSSGVTGERGMREEGIGKREEGTVGGPGSEGTWTHGLDFTPGGLNHGQTIPEGWFLPPNGTNTWVYFTVVGAHLSQSIGDDTSRSTLVILPQGRSTNVVYTAEPWYEMAAVTVDGVTNATHKTGVWPYEFRVPEGSGTMVNVVATEGVDARLDDDRFGLKGQRYRDAVVKWLQRWPDKSPDDIRFARYGHLRTFPATRLMSLIEMYWLDIPPFNSEGSAFEPTEGMDPLSSEWVFRGGFTDYAPSSVLRQKSWGRVTNSVFKVKLLITNEWDSVANPTHAPRTLQGLNNESSAAGDYTGGWTSVSFKVYGLLNVNLEGGFNKGFKPFREFTFGPGSFGAKGAVGTPTVHYSGESLGSAGTPGEFETVIELLDPFSKGSIGYEYGWWRHPNTTSCFFKWQLDNADNTPVTVETLKARDVYGE